MRSIPISLDIPGKLDLAADWHNTAVMQPDVKRDRPRGANFLPDFCSGQAVLPLLFFIELIAILLTLAAAPAGPVVWEKFLLLSLYLQWIGLCSAVALCLIRQWTQATSSLGAAAIAYVSLLLLTGVLAETAYHTLYSFGLRNMILMQHSEFLVRNLGVCAIAAALALRYFWVQHQWRQQTLRQGEVRYALLQARIRPHFLFNSLNSIAALTAIKPAAAEDAIVDLSALLRASLDASGRDVTLAQELALAQAYLRIEQHRLGERLRVDWQLRATESLRLPALCLQPLVENAVRHGIEPLPTGGLLRIEIAQTAAGLEIEVRNPVPDSSGSATAGFGEALSNIEERLRLRYGAQASLETSSESDEFVVRLKLPTD